MFPETGSKSRTRIRTKTSEHTGGIRWEEKGPSVFKCRQELTLGVGTSLLRNTGPRTTN